HAAPETPGSIHEGGELGYALSHAFGAAFDNPELVVACVVGDGEAETGPLATSWPRSSAATGGSLWSSRATTRSRCTRISPRRSTRPSTGSPRSSRRRASAATRRGRAGR